MSGAISDLSARAILDSRGNPTVEVDCYVDGSLQGRAAVPSGASTGSYEAIELRDGGHQWAGKGVSSAVANVNGEIRDALIGMEVSDQVRHVGTSVQHALMSADRSQCYVRPFAHVLQHALLRLAPEIVRVAKAIDAALLTGLANRGEADPASRCRRGVQVHAQRHPQEVADQGA